MKRRERVGTLLLEGEVVGQVPTLVIAAEHEKGIGVQYLVTKHQVANLDREVTTVDIVTLDTRGKINNTRQENR